MTFSIKHVVLGVLILANNVSMQAAQGAYTSAWGAVGAGGASEIPGTLPPSYDEALNLNPPASYSGPGYNDMSLVEKIRDRLENSSNVERAVAVVGTVAATYALYKTGAAAYASHAAFKHSAALVYHLSWLLGAGIAKSFSGLGYCLSKAGNATGIVPAFSGMVALVTGGYIGWNSRGQSDTADV